MINFVRALMNEVDSRQDQICINNVNRVMEISRIKKKARDKKDTVTEMKDTFGGFISKPDLAEETLS